MGETFEQDVGTAFYRTKDPIKNLKIRVNLERVTSATLVPQAVLEKETNGEVEMQQLQEQQFAGKKDDEMCVFQWQEKVFSKREVELYRNKDDCVTPLAREYHQATNKYRDSDMPRPTNRLFSYVNNDSFSNTRPNIHKMTTDINEEPTWLAEKIANVRQRKAGGSQFKRDLAGGCQVSYDPSEELKRKNHLPSTAIQTMYIIGDLTPPGREPTEADEQVLCTIKFDANGVISICPDFSKGRNPYRLETSGIGRDVYEYTLEHVSEKMSRLEADKESKMIKQLYSRHAEYLSSLIGSEFEQMPQLDTLRILLYGEIESAQDFEYDDLYVQFFVDLPDCWYPVSGKLSAVTQICSTKSADRTNVAYFSYPFNFELVYKSDSLDTKKSEQLPRWPTLLFEVLSLDSWERYRNEGYAYTVLPSTPGCHNLKLNCWRPTGGTFASEMRRFFIGGSPELEDTTYMAVPSTFNGPQLSKFGFRTVSTGSINVKLNVIQQSQAFLHTTSSKKRMGTLLDRLGASTAQATILGIMDAFQRAKRRMISARENLKKDFIETLKTYQGLDED